MVDPDSYVRRADNAERRARECLENIRLKPQSRAAYEAEHDWMIAEMFYYDALARAARDPDQMTSELSRFRERITSTPVSSTAIDQHRFLEHLRSLLDRSLAANMIGGDKS